MMKWLKEQNRQASAFLHGDFSSTLWMCAAAFGLLILAGFILGLVLKDFADGLVNSFAQQIEDMGIMGEDGSISAFALLRNNVRATLFTVAYGFIPFIFLPALSLGTNALLLGAFAAYYVNQGKSLLLYLAGIVPHGIFELPAIVLAIAMGIYLCRLINYYIKQNPKNVMLPLMKDLLRVFVLRLIPLLVLASAIEAYVTPLVMGLF